VLETIALVSIVDAEDSQWERVFENSLDRARVRQELAAGRLVWVAVQVFAVVERRSGADRIGGTMFGPVEVDATRDPTNDLIGAAYSARDHLGTLYGDLRIAGLNVDRWELYAAPFRVVLDERAESLLRPLMRTAL
jgi:hypothetical protein